MREYLTYATKDRVKILGYYQLIGGIIGLVLWIKMLVNTGEFTGLIFLFVLIILGLFLYSIYVGFQTLRLKNNWILHSQINQLFQFLSLSLLGFTYHYFSGIGFFIGLDMTDSYILKYDLSLLSNCHLEYNLHPDQIIIKFNIFAFFVLYYIARLDKRIKTETEIRKAQ